MIGNLWSALGRQGWESKLPGLAIGARETSLAHSGPTNPLTAAEAARLVKERIDIPLRGNNDHTRNSGRSLPLTADHIVLWTWRQTFGGQTWRLADAATRDHPGGRPNAMLDALRARHSRTQLSVTYNPHEPETSIPDDIRIISASASTIYVVGVLLGRLR
ncbi:hypothetical protein [Nonomuraea sp. KM90]|uniref:hypothetical protein n=1 Tax=Nonomuraea sp. KM90 TaxID=3457428 RepID=UPI003FCDA5DF